MVRLFVLGGEVRRRGSSGGRNRNPASTTACDDSGEPHRSTRGARGIVRLGDGICKKQPTDFQKPLRFQPGQRYLVVVAAVRDGWCAVLDTDRHHLEPVRLVTKRSISSPRKEVTE